jgi:hypothetical protein
MPCRQALSPRRVDMQAWQLKSNLT